MMLTDTTGQPVTIELTGKIIVEYLPGNPTKITTGDGREILTDMPYRKVCAIIEYPLNVKYIRNLLKP